MLVRCLYVSRASSVMKPNVLDDILRQSRKNNAKTGVTGMLCFANDVFVQVLEGGRKDVSALLGSIFRDDRHQDLQILLFEEIAERRFRDWSMGQVNVEKVNPALLLKYGERAELNPYAVSGHATLALMHELVATGAIVHRAT